MNSNLSHKPSLKAFAAFWNAPMQRGRWAAFRIAHGLSLLLFLSAWWMHFEEWLTPAGFHLPGSIVPLLSNAAVFVFGAAQFLCLGCFIAGWHPRIFAALTWGSLLYVTLADPLAAFAINKIYLFSFAVLAVFNPNTIAPARLLQLGMVAIYFSSGWHKAVYGDWFFSTTALQTALHGIYMTDLAAWALSIFPGWMWTVIQYAVVCFELCAPVLFFNRRTVWIAIIGGCAFHLSISIFMDQISLFSLQMVSFYVLFLPEQITERPKLRKWQTIVR